MSRQDRNTGQSEQKCVRTLAIRSKKAVDASTEDILKELNLENTQANRDAVRNFLRKIRWRLQKKVLKISRNPQHPSKSDSEYETGNGTCDDP